MKRKGRVVSSILDGKEEEGKREDETREAGREGVSLAHLLRSGDLHHYSEILNIQYLT